MSRYTGAKHRIVRRLGPLPGFLRKAPKRQKQFPPGEHGPAAAQNARSRNTVFGKRLQAKQRLLYNYGIRERQLRSYLKLAKSVKRPMIEVVLEFLESRLDTVVYRALSLPSIRAARQIVSHGHVKVNGSKLDIPSYPCKKEDTLEVPARLLHALGQTKRPKTSYFVKDEEGSEYLRVTAIHKLRRSRLPAQLDTKLIAEYYSRIL